MGGFIGNVLVRLLNCERSFFSHRGLPHSMQKIATPNLACECRGAKHPGKRLSLGCQLSRRKAK
jgi:hypothetical protein